MSQLPRQVSIVVPTFNEAKNIRPLVDRLTDVLVDYDWEVIFVDDDSPDLTWKTAKQTANENKRVRCLRRTGRRGLSGACIEGILSSSAPIVAVMDGDLQHDETILPRMIEKITQKNFDLVVGSRYVNGGSLEEGFSQKRAMASKVATYLAHKATRTEISDVMSGFFAMRRDCFDAVADRLSTSGFKILLDILATAQSSLRVTEVEYSFRKREDGESKFDMRAAWDFIGLLANKASHGLIPARFVQFLFVGSIGILVHITVLRIAMLALQLDFGSSQVIATLVAMTNNFFINNILTYRDMKLKGLALIKGLFSFYIICSAGALANVGIADWIFGQHQAWWLSGLAGAMIGAVWNYSASSLLVWRH